MWTRQEIVDWHHAFRARMAAANGQPNARLEDLVDATLRLLMAHPGEEISIRQIAAEAGVAHSDLYRYANSKDQLIDLAIARLEQSMTTSLPKDFDALFSNADRLLELAQRAAPGIRVLTDRAIQGKLGSPNSPLPVSVVAAMIPPSPEGAGQAIDPRVKAGMCRLHPLGHQRAREPLAGGAGPRGDPGRAGGRDHPRGADGLTGPAQQVAVECRITRRGRARARSQGSVGPGPPRPR